MIQRLPVQLSSNTVPGVPAVFSSTGVVFWSKGNPGGGNDYSTYTYCDYVSTSPVLTKYRGVCNVCHDTGVNYYSMSASTPTHMRSIERCPRCHSHNEKFEAKGCKDCHLLVADDPAISGTRRAIVGEFANNWGHGRSSTQTDRVTDRDCSVCIWKGKVRLTRQQLLGTKTV